MTKKCRKRFYALGVLVAFSVIMLVIAGVEKGNVYAGDGHSGHASGWIDLSTISGTDSYEHEITTPGNYYLSGDVTSSEKSQFLHVTGDIDVTICLNGHDICTNNSNIITTDNSARVTITNCSDEESKIDAGTAIGVLINQNGGSLALENVTLVEKQGSYYEYPLVRVQDSGNLTVKNVKFDSQGFCIHLKETGYINIANSTFTVDCSSLDGGGKIIYTDMDKTIGNITVTDSIFNWDKNDGISITTPDHGSVNISGSTFNCSGGISVKGGEVNVSDCIFEGTDKNSLGSAIYMTSVAAKDNKLTVSGGKYNTRYSGINVDSRNAAVDVTLKGNIEFNHTSECGDLTLCYRYEPYTAQVNLHMDELTTQSLTMDVPSTEYEGAITCDADYSAKLKARDTKYAVHCEEANGKYVVKFNERKITTQPTVDSTKVEVSDNTGVSFQWYKAGEKAYELNVAGIEGVLIPGENYRCYVGSYENGVWKPGAMGPEEGMYGVMFQIGDFKENCTVVIENTKGSLEEYKDCFFVSASENPNSFESEVKDGKLYFSGKADGLIIYVAGVPQDAELIVKLIVPNDTEALQGQNTNTLTAAQPGDYRCHAIWDAGTDYKYELLSDVLTLTQAVTPEDPETPEDPADPGKDPVDPGKDPETPEEPADTHEHKWSDWVTDGDRQKATCDCGGVKYRDIPAADDNGKFEKEAEVTETSPIKEATLDNNKSDFVSADSKIFSDEEKAAIANGTVEVKVWVSIDGKDETALSQEDKAKIEDAAKKAVGNDNLDITYFDATLFKKVGTQQTTVAEPGIDIKVTIKIPEKLINTDSTKNREYSIIRLHGEDGSVETLGGTFNSETGEFTFVTDKFSTYAIVYKDVAVTDVVDETPKTGEGTTTGDAAGTAVWFMLIMLSGLGLVLPYAKRRCTR
ncbi:MAG: right-handed parallel beta-helix repeat-containing protein [Lachnospira sp.]